jgi:hypothetical protein
MDNPPATPQGNEETVEARARAVLPEDIWRSIPVYMHKSIEQRLAAALAPLIREHGEGVRELAAEIVDEAARCWTWEAGDEAGHAYRLKACAERREEWEDDDCPHDGSCVECVSDMHEHFETSASKERRRELRNLAAKIRGLPAHVIVRQSLGEYLPCEHSSEIVNELGNTIKFRIFAQAGQTRDGDDGGLPKVVVHAFGPTSKAIHTWTVNEARELHRLLSLAFPTLSAQPVNWEALLYGRDEFIVRKGLWGEFVEQLPGLAQPVKDAVLKAEQVAGVFERAEIWTPNADTTRMNGPAVAAIIREALSPKSPASVGLDPEAKEADEA